MLVCFIPILYKNDMWSSKTTFLSSFRFNTQYDHHMTLVVSDKMMNEENLGNQERETRHYFFWPTMNKMQTKFDFAEFAEFNPTHC